MWWMSVDRHNTAFTGNFGNAAIMVAESTPKADSFIFANNISSSGLYGFIGNSTGSIQQTLTRWFTSNAIYNKNLMVSPYPDNFAGSFSISNISNVGFVDVAMGNYSLLPSSPYSAGNITGGDGKDLGADQAAIAAAVGP
jgi:hypothetical protein